MLGQKDKRVENLYDIIGHGTLSGNDTIIGQLNKINEILKKNNETYPQKQETVEQAIQQLESKKTEQEQSLQKINDEIEQLKKQLSENKTVEEKHSDLIQQTFKDNSALIGSGKLQTNSQNLIDAINELLGLINQSLNSNSIMIILDQLSDEMFASNEDHMKLFMQQMQVQILNCGNLYSILLCAENQIREKLIGEKNIRFGIQDRTMFIEEMQLKDNSKPDIRYQWDEGFQIVLDHSPRIMKSYTEKLLKNLSQPQGFKYMIGSLKNGGYMIEFNQTEQLKLSNLEFYSVKFNCPINAEKCEFHFCDFQLKYYKRASMFNDCTIGHTKIFVPKFAETNEGIQLEILNCWISASKIESYYLFTVNEGQLTPDQVDEIHDSSFTIINQCQEDVDYQFASESNLKFYNCEFKVIDPVQKGVCELYIDGQHCQLTDCDISVVDSEGKYTPKSLVTIEGGEISGCKFTAENVKFLNDEKQQSVKKCLIKSKSGYTVEGEKFVQEENVQLTE